VVDKPSEQAVRALGMAGGGDDDVVEEKLVRVMDRMCSLVPQINKPCSSGLPLFC
jgi:hypothetical protein